MKVEIKKDGLIYVNGNFIHMNIVTTGNIKDNIEEWDETFSKIENVTIAFDKKIVTVE